MSKKDEILSKLCQKAATKQSVYRTAKDVFEELKIVLKEIAQELHGEMCTIDENVQVEYKEKGAFEAELRFSGDVLIFHLHTNTFQFEKNHHIWKSSYTKEDEYRTYCGVINVYNFLSDSFKYNRENDLGHLIGRIFINKDQHFFVEGKGRLSFLYNNFPNAILDKTGLKKILQEAILFSMDFELLTPPFNEVQLVTLHEMKEMSQNLKIKTAKRLGYRFSKEK
ncbi:MAG: hypothetical protein H8D62_01180 [Bacteroidetes bacterium]|nr:hypothetical protein [Bacteroidota bacterium]